MLMHCMNLDENLDLDWTGILSLSKFSDVCFNLTSHQPTLHKYYNSPNVEKFPKVMGNKPSVKQKM